MGLLSLRRDIKDLARLREIVTILVKQGFHQLVSKARLTRHAKVSERLKPGHMETTPQRVRETLEKLGPTFVKLGQILSLRPDLIPHRYCEEFKKLQDDVEPLSYPVVKGVVETELKHPLRFLFDKFHHEPVAAASVSQVHKAKLHDGRLVAVKVQRPGVREVMERDIDIMEYLAKRLDKHLRGVSALEIVKEFKEYTERELDFTFERRTLKKFHKHFEDHDKIIIPDAYDDHCTGKVLTMEFIKGVRVSDKVALKRAKYDLPKLGNIGFEATFDQVFNLGIFHADPHPGNLLALRREGRQCLAFLDFGIVGFVDEEMRLRFLQLLDYLVKRDVRGVTWTLLKIGRRRAGLEIKDFEESVAETVLDWHGSTLRDEKMSALVYRLLTSCMAQGLEMPANVILVAKAFVTMEGAAAWLNPDFNPVESIGPAVKRLGKLSFGRTKEEVLRATRDLHDFASKLPMAADTLLDKIEEGKLALRVDRDEFKRAEQDYDLETSKRSLALTSGAFFIGSAVLAALAAELEFVGIPLWQLGFGLFIVTLLMFIHVSIKTHKYMQRQL